MRDDRKEKLHSICMELIRELGNNDADSNLRHRVDSLRTTIDFGKSQYETVSKMLTVLYKKKYENESLSSLVREKAKQMYEVLNGIDIEKKLSEQRF